MSTLREHYEQCLNRRRGARLLGAVSVLALALGAQAIAAPAKKSLGAKPAEAAAPAVEPETKEFSWDGAHAGVNMGAGFASGAPLHGLGTDPMLLPNEAWAYSSGAISGPVGGLQAGWSKQFGPAVVGVEADMQAAGVSGGASGLSTMGAFVSHRQSIDWFGTVRGRLGYLIIPSVLAYGTGGFAFGSGSSHFNYLTGDWRAAENVNAPTRTGYAVGGGLEWAILPEWSAKLEYLYVNLGNNGAHVLNQTDISAGDATTLANAVTQSGTPSHMHTIRMGLNYHFTPYASTDPVTALSPVDIIGKPDEKFHEIETHYIFGFTDGADIDAEGEKELEVYTTVGWRRRRMVIAPDDPDALTKLASGMPNGDYRMLSQKIEFEHTLTQNFQYALGVTGMNHQIGGVQGLDNLHNTSLYGMSGEFRYVLLGRGPESPFGVTIQTEPEWGHVSSSSGQRETAFSTETRLVVDTELVPNRLYAAANVVYEPEVARGLGENKWGQESTLGLTGAMTYRLTPRIALGGDLQYYRLHSGGFAFDRLEGQSFYVGPHIHVRFARKAFVAASFATQVAGHAVGDIHSLDMTNFNRNMARVQFGIEF
jgi:opacity protein-like surface antigen